DFGAYADDTVLIEVLHSFLADVRNFRCKFFFAALRVAYFEFKLLDVDRRVDVVAHHAFGNNDRVLEVVPLPWHIGHEQVPSQREFATGGSVALAQRLSLHHLFAFPDERGDIDARILVGPAELDQVIRLVFVVEAHEPLLVVHLVVDDNLPGVDSVYSAGSVGKNGRTEVARNAAFQPHSHDPRFLMHEGTSLTLHV